MDMNFIWNSIGQNNGYGYRLSLFNNDEEVGEVLVFKKNDQTIRMNWLMVMKKYQRQGYGKILLEELKGNVHQYFPNAQVIIFESVTSMGTLKLIEEVFGKTTWVLEFMTESMRHERIKAGVGLPLLSPARYNSDGSSKLTRTAMREDFKVTL